MENLLLKLAGEVPSLIVLVYVIIALPKHFNSAIDKLTAFIDKRDERVFEMQKECSEVIKKNTEVASRVEKLLDLLKIQRKSGG